MLLLAALYSYSWNIKMGSLSTELIIISLAAVGILSALIFYFMQPKSKRMNSGKPLFKPESKEQRKKGLKWEFLFFVILFALFVLPEQCAN